jgi:hypothetical protein
MPRGAAPFIEAGGAAFLCLYDKNQPDVNALRLAYHAARRLVVISTKSQSIQVDSAGLREDIVDARTLLRSITNLKSQLSQLSGAVSKAAQSASGELDSLRRSLNELFLRMESRIGDVSTSGQAS